MFGTVYKDDHYIGATEINKDFNIHITELRFDSVDVRGKKILGFIEELQKRKENKNTGTTIIQ